MSALERQIGDFSKPCPKYLSGCTKRFFIWAEHDCQNHVKVAHYYFLSSFFEKYVRSKTSLHRFIVCRFGHSSIGQCFFYVRRAWNLIIFGGDFAVFCIFYEPNLITSSSASFWSNFSAYPREISGNFWSIHIQWKKSFNLVYLVISD